jgi:hypothetical protein
MYRPCLLLDPEILAPSGLCCPAHHRLSTSSASLILSCPLPSIAGYWAGLWHSRTLLPEHQAFRAFGGGLSRIAAFNFRREPTACSPQFLPQWHWPSGRSVEPLALSISCNRLSAGHAFDGLSVRFRYGPSVCSPPVSVRPEPLARPSKASTSGLPVSQVTLITAGYNYDVTLGPTSAGLSPASPSPSLAAPDPAVQNSRSRFLGVIVPLRK